MQKYKATTQGPLLIKGFIDPDDVTNIEVFWGAPLFLINTMYRVGDIVRPTVNEGYYYTIIQMGKSGALEPVWCDDIITTGDDPCNLLILKKIPYNLFIGPDDVITASTWSATDGVTLITPTFDSVRAGVTIQSIPSNISSFDLTNQVTKSTGEKRSRSYRYTVNQQ